MTHDMASFCDVLTMLAAGILKQHAEIQRERPHKRLNIALYCGWERLTAYATYHRVAPPDQLSDLTRWLHTPLHHWNLPIPDGLENAALLIDGSPTPLCYHLAGDWVDAVAVDLTQPVSAFTGFVEECFAL